MKKLKIYILAILVPIIFVGCMEKGKSDTGINTGNITVNKDISDSIRANLSFVLYKYNNSTFLLKDKINPDSETSIYGLLKKIYDGYLYGETSSNDVALYQSQILTQKSDFFSANSLLTYDNMIATDSNITKQITAMRSETTPDLPHIADLEAIQAMFIKFYTLIKDNVTISPYYFELDESIALKAYLDNTFTTDNPKVSYSNLLKNYNIIDNANLKDKYTALIKLVNQNLDIINNNGVVTNINELLNQLDPKITTVYAIKNVYTTAQLSEIKNSLLKIKSLYNNYGTNAANILSAEQAFYLLEREYIQTLSESYYYKIRFSSTKLSIQQLNNTDLLAKLVRIQNLPSPVGVDTEKLKIIINNLTYSLSRLNSYDALNLKDSYSACILAGQMIQMLKDNKVYIDVWLSSNP